MEMRYLRRLLIFHWRFIAGVSLAAALAGWLLTYGVVAEEYEASTTILIRPQEEVTFASSENKAMMDYPVSFNIPAESMSETYAEIMTSEAVAIRVVDLLELDRLVSEPDPRWYMRIYHRVRDWAKRTLIYVLDLARYGRVQAKDPYWKAVEAVLDGLEAKPIGDTYLFSLTAIWPEPRFAAVIADTAANAFVDYTREARQSEDGTSAAFLSQRLADVGQEVEAMRRELDVFYQENGAPWLNKQLELKLAALSEFANADEDALKRLLEVQAELEIFEDQLDGQNQEIHSSTTLARNPVVVHLQEDLARYEVDLAGLRQTHMPEHPAVRTLVSKIEETQNRLESETPQVRWEDTTITNPIHSDLTAKLLDRGATEGMLLARRSALRQSMDRYQAEVDRLTLQKSKLEQLTLLLELRENEYRMIAEEHGEARLAAAQEISEIRVLHPAIAPVYPARPIKIYYAGTGLAMGFLLALSFLILREYMEPLLISEEDAERALGAPVLATVPGIKLRSGTIALLGEEVTSAELTWGVLANDTFLSKRRRGSDSGN